MKIHMMKFAGLVDTGKLQQLCESFTAMTGAVTAILDLKGDILVATGWQDICTRFHRVHPVTAARCRESDTTLAGQLASGESYSLYKCKNGLVDVAVPILIADEHAANFFTGQFFLEPPDREYFACQAEEIGFDKAAYLEALDKVPIYTENQVRKMMEFFSRLARLIGEMGLAGETLRLSEERYRSVVENISIGVTMISPDMKILGQNACMQRWFPHIDVTRQPVCYESYINPPRDSLCVNCPTYRTLQDGEVHDAIIETPAGDRTLYFRVRSSPIMDKEGNVVAATEMVEDVTERQRTETELRQHREQLEELVAVRTEELEKTNTRLQAELGERKRAEEMIRASEEKFARAFHHSPNLMAITTPEDGRIVEINETYCTVLGLTAEECIGHTTTDLKIWEDSRQREHILRQISEEGIARNVEVDLRRKSGEICSVVLSMEGIIINGQEHLLSVATDITERKRTEIALGKSEARFRRLADNARDVIYRMSLPEGIYEYMSQAATEMFGYAPEEFYHSPYLIRKIIHPAWLTYFEEEWAKLLKGEMPPTYEFQLIHKSGEIRWVNQRNILVRDDSGQIIAIEGIITDITARKSTEVELQRMNEELEQRVTERTAELARKNEELERMNKLFVGRELRMAELKERIRELELMVQNRQ